RYYPASLKPDEYDIRQSSHDDINVSKLSSPSVAMYNKALLHVLQATDVNYV
ncbi:hypothetical protein F5887DRAFT_880325, partial [Amanita rubescens]